MNSNVFHDELQLKCPAYKALSDAKLRGWKSETYVRPRVVLATYEKYADNYRVHLLPKLPPSDGTQLRSKFFDMGSAPGGLCQAILEWPCMPDGRNNWYGVAVTLDPAEGGIPMRYVNESLEVRFANVQSEERFLEDSVHAEDVEAYSFVNMGIVIDYNVRRHLNGSVPFYQQLTTQIRATKLLLKPKGSFMMVLNWDYHSLPEVLCTFHILLQHADALHMLPTVYTSTAGRKQFYLLVNGVTLTTELLDDLTTAWRKGFLRHSVALKRKIAQNTGEEYELTPDETEAFHFPLDVVRAVIDSITNSPVIDELSSYCDMLREALEEGNMF
ncbi:hypothetical protein XU18_0733 [Perkinsela sp. CCAP 1560/4]|nr:hypothetical protein XU18_0733 [Perkinsela sp. CCAP 1560/4]|eukprot:KNH08878.1 hypothetical protein XU18_0733 [Perkinsela sp. CCAP 1560/4]